MSLRGEVALRTGGHMLQSPYSVLIIEPSLAWSIQAAEPSALRAVILIALLHYRQNTGTLHHFYLTYLQHKAECIQMVNRHLQDLNPQMINLCLKLVSILSILEVPLGFYSEAEGRDNSLVLDTLRRLKQSRASHQRHLSPPGENGVSSVRCLGW